MRGSYKPPRTVKEEVLSLPEQLKKRLDASQNSVIRRLDASQNSVNKEVLSLSEQLRRGGSKPPRTVRKRSRAVV